MEAVYRADPMQKSLWFLFPFKSYFSTHWCKCLSDGDCHVLASLARLPFLCGCVICSWSLWCLAAGSSLLVYCCVGESHWACSREDFACVFDSSRPHIYVCDPLGADFYVWCRGRVHLYSFVCGYQMVAEICWEAYSSPNFLAPFSKINLTINSRVYLWINFCPIDPSSSSTCCLHYCHLEVSAETRNCDSSHFVIFVQDYCAGLGLLLHF